MAQYPLSENAKDSIKSKTGKSLDEITIENVLNGNVTSEDIKISKETLFAQGEIGEKYGRPQLKQNFERASELVDIPDDLIMKIYNMLRPHRATKAELLEMAQLLKEKYNSKECVKLILEAADIYEKRGVLKQ